VYFSVFDSVVVAEDAASKEPSYLVLMLWRWEMLKIVPFLQRPWISQSKELSTRIDSAACSSYPVGDYYDSREGSKATFCWARLYFQEFLQPQLRGFQWYWRPY
jgi:hypothetical protein